ncbi:hypothetical protein Y032_0255g344 [Ancylostoma ceylanicum]|nr:hypothetical protein Y032_0255g344 [Ancylostoma ceylanicum]
MDCDSYATILDEPTLILRHFNDVSESAVQNSLKDLHCVTQQPNWSKKRRYHAFFDHETPDNWRVYCAAKKAARKVVATIKAAYYDEVSTKLNTRDGERLIYRPAKSRQRKGEDIEKFHGINDERGQLLMDRKQVTKRWRDYFEHISTGELDHQPNPSPIQKITTEETVAALKQMKVGKTTGPDD